MSPGEQFEADKKAEMEKMANDRHFLDLTRQWFLESLRHRYSYHFTWMGRPIIQYPQDIVALQEIIWEVKPDLIVETGVAHGGGCIFYASMLELNGGPGRVVAIDIDIRPHNRQAIEQHRMAKRITLLDGSAVDEVVVEKVRILAGQAKSVLVVLDSMHTHEHVARELALYAPLVTRGSYLVVLDTVIEDVPDDFFPDKPWSHGNSPKTAVREFLKKTDRFVIDGTIMNKVLISVAPEGYLRCVRD